MLRPPYSPVYVATIAEGSVDRHKRSLQSESTAVTHEDVVVINIVVVVVIWRFWQEGAFSRRRARAYLD